MGDNAKKVVQSQPEITSAKRFAIQNRIFGGIAVIGLPPPVFPETQFFVKTSCGDIRVSHFKKNGIAVGLLNLKQQSVHQLLPDSHPADGGSNDDILELPFGRHVPGHEKT
jgi:hypothetical protein